MKISYEKINNFDFQSAMQKLMSAPAVPGHVAYRYRKIAGPIVEKRREIADEYRKDILEVYAQKGEDGKYDEQAFKCVEGKDAEFEKAQEDFGKRTFDIDRPQLTSTDVEVVKLSAKEQEALVNAGILDESGFENEPAAKGPQLRRA